MFDATADRAIAKIKEQLAEASEEEQNFMRRLAWSDPQQVYAARHIIGTFLRRQRQQDLQLSANLVLHSTKAWAVIGLTRIGRRNVRDYYVLPISSLVQLGITRRDVSIVLTYDEHEDVPYIRVEESYGKRRASAQVWRNFPLIGRMKRLPVGIIVACRTRLQAEEWVYHKSGKASRLYPFNARTAHKHLPRPPSN